MDGPIDSFMFKISISQIVVNCRENKIMNVVFIFQFEDSITKGQLISKALEFFQKTNERICFFCLTVVKTNLFVRFLEEFEDTKKIFRN